MSQQGITQLLGLAMQNQQRSKEAEIQEKLSILQMLPMLQQVAGQGGNGQAMAKQMEAMQLQKQLYGQAADQQDTLMEIGVSSPQEIGNPGQALAHTGAIATLLGGAGFGGRDLLRGYQGMSGFGDKKQRKQIRKRGADRSNWSDYYQEKNRKTYEERMRRPSKLREVKVDPDKNGRFRTTDGKFATKKQAQKSHAYRQMENQNKDIRSQRSQYKYQRKAMDIHKGRMARGGMVGALSALPMAASVGYDMFTRSPDEIADSAQKAYAKLSAETNGFQDLHPSDLNRVDSASGKTYGQIFQEYEQLAAQNENITNGNLYGNVSQAAQQGQELRRGTTELDLLMQEAEMYSRMPQQASAEDAVRLARQQF